MSYYLLSRVAQVARAAPKNLCKEARLRSRRKQLVAVGATVALLALAGCKGNSTTGASGGGGGGSSSDPGITKTSVTIGTIADLTGPVPGLFQGAVDGVKAYDEYINSLGGINGRTINDTVKDSALSCSQDEAGATALAPKVFSIVGSFTLYDTCSIPTLQKNPGLPYIGITLNSKVAAIPNVYSPQPLPLGFRTGAYKYIKDHYHVSRMGIIAGSGAQQPQEQAEFNAAKSVGVTLAYTRFVGSTETDFTSDVIRMRKANVDWVFLGTVDVQDAAHFIQDAAAQNWHPKVIQAATAYDGKFFGLLPKPSIANGVLVDQTFGLFLGEDAASSPGIKLFDTWFAKANPGVKPDLFAMYGWVSGQLFGEALKNAGPNPTRASVLTALKGVHNFTGGVLAPDDPGAKKPATCWMLAEVENSTYKRLLPAKSGFTCSPGGFYYAPSS
jgi:ABC-type branched-subunit amino acid transport system substrate-binding protein